MVTILTFTSPRPHIAVRMSAHGIVEVNNHTLHLYVYLANLMLLGTDSCSNNADFQIEARGGDGDAIQYCEIQ